MAAQLVKAPANHFGSVIVPRLTKAAVGCFFLAATRIANDGNISTYIDEFA
jgi:hypothetical protein